MTELVIVSKPRTAYKKWVGGGVYKQFLETVSTPTILFSMSSRSGTPSAYHNLFSGGVTRVAERFTVSTNIVNPQIFGAVVRLARSGTPTGTLYVNLRNDSDGVPGTVLTTIGSIDVSTLSTSFTDYNFTMSSPYSLTAGTPYWVTVEYSGGSSSNYVSTYQWSVGGHTRGYYTTSWNIETGQIAAQVRLRGTVRQIFDFIYYGPAAKRLQIDSSNRSNINITGRRVNNQSFSSDTVKENSIPQANQYTIEYDCESTITSTTGSSNIFLSTTRYLHYAKTVLTLDDLGASEAYITKVYFTSAGQLRINDDPDADLIYMGGTSVSFDSQSVPLRKLEWLQGGGEVDILVVE